MASTDDRAETAVVDPAVPEQRTGGPTPRRSVTATVGSVPEARTRVVVAAADQGLSSAQNFAMLLVTAKALSAHEFGRFSVVFAIAILALQLEQAVISEPLLLRASRAPETLERGFATGHSVALLLSLVIAGCSALAALFVSADLAHPLLWLAVAMPGLLLFDVARFEELAAGRVFRMLSLDVAWTAIWVAGALVVRPHSTSQAIGTWALSASVVAVAYLAVRRLPFAGVSAAVREWRHGELPKSARSLFAEMVATNSSGQVATFAVTGFLGFAATGGLRAAMALLGPLATLYNAARLAVIPEVIRAGGSGSRRGRLLLDGSTAGFTVVSIAVAAVVLALPTGAGHALLGDTWRVAREVLPAICVARIAGALTFRSLGALRADNRLRSLAIARWVSDGYLIVAILTAAPLLTVTGTAWAMAAATVAGMLTFEAAERFGRERAVTA